MPTKINTPFPFLKCYITTRKPFNTLSKTKTTIKGITPQHYNY